MDNMEKWIWCAAFANEFSRERKWMMQYGRTIDDISGFSCGEIADAAVAAFREAISGYDAKYLTPVKDKWVK